MNPPDDSTVPTPVPRLAFVHADDVAFTEVVAQEHPGGRRVSAYNKFLEWTDRRLVNITRYDPGLVLERHAHASDHVVFVLEGDLEIGGRPCPTGTLIVLEQGAVFGPLIAGADGCTLFEHWAGDPMPVPVDPDLYHRTLDERGITRLPNPPFDPPAHLSNRERFGRGDRFS